MPIIIGITHACVYIKDVHNVLAILEIKQGMMEIRTYVAGNINSTPLSTSEQWIQDSRS